MAKTIQVRFVGTKRVLDVKLEPGTQLRDLREALHLGSGYHLARAASGEILHDEEADLYEMLAPGEEVLVSPRAELGTSTKAEGPKAWVVREQAGSPGEPFWRRWGWQAVEEGVGRLVLEGVYRTLRGPVSGRIEISPVGISFFTRGRRGEWEPRCIQASSVEQGILTLQSVMRLAPPERLQIRARYERTS